MHAYMYTDTKPKALYALLRLLRLTKGNDPDVGRLLSALG
jgi:hypothetical protein